jgi:uncharacterized membrane protein YdbT with pleckstrin-like domain
MDTLMRLKNVRLFASLAPDNLARVAELVTSHCYPKGSFLCRQDEFGETLYVIDSGEAILRQTDLRGIERPVGYLREGDFIGDDALLLGDAYGSCVQATTDIQVLGIRKQDFDRLLEEHPEIGEQLTVRRLLQERLQAPDLPWLDEDESALLLRRRHWFALVPKLPIPLFTLLALSTAVWLLGRLGFAMSTPLTLLFSGAVPAGMVLWHLADWRNDYFLVTAKRVLHEEKVILLYQTWDQALLSKIQNISITRDLMGSKLGFGTMQIQTAGARGTLLLDYLPDPEGMKEVIFKQVGRLRSRGRQEEREKIRQELLQQTGSVETGGEPVIHPLLPQEQPKKKLGLLGRLLPARPLLGSNAKQAHQITWRKHWVFLAKRVYLVLPLFVLVTAVLIAVSLFRRPAQYRFALFVPFLILWIVAILRLWWLVEDWRNDVYIVTDHLIIDVERRPLSLREERREANLDKIVNLSLRQQGFLASILNYGDVLIQTAGATGDFTFDGVSNPAAVQREIFRRVEEYNDEQQRREREQRKAELSTWFQVYHEISQGKEPPGAA